MTRSSIQLPSNVHVVGCGGGGSWLLPALARLATPATTIHLWDGDKLEHKNLERQLFDESDIGRFKCEALAERYYRRAVLHQEYFFEGSEIEPGALLLCCADNHTARRNVLRKVDEIEGSCIIGGNEYTSDDAYYYDPSFHASPNDPRVFAPEINDSRDGDPRQPDGCTGMAQVERPQLVVVNIGSVYYMLKLLWWWFAERRELGPENRGHWPVMFHGTPNRLFVVKLGDRAS